MDERSERIASRIEPLLMIAALLVIPALVISESDPANPIGIALNWVSWLIFLAEALIMLAVVPDRRRWIREHPIEVMVVLLTPPLVTAFTSLRLLRLLALVRLLRVGSLAKRLFSMAGLRYAAMLAALTAFVGGSAFASVEPDQSTWNGIYWAVTTMTTVGYGDPQPTTTAAKIVAIIIMLVGIGFTAVLTAAFAQRFLLPNIEQEEEQAHQEIGATGAAILAELREVRVRLETLEEKA
jgi:voltage-gated potassium channel